MSRYQLKFMACYSVTGLAALHSLPDCLVCTLITVTSYDRCMDCRPQHVSTEVMLTAAESHAKYVGTSIKTRKHAHTHTHPQAAELFV